jgi:hypothetical protein
LTRTVSNREESRESFCTGVNPLLSYSKQHYKGDLNMLNRVPRLVGFTGLGLVSALVFWAPTASVAHAQATPGSGLRGVIEKANVNKQNNHDFEEIEAPADQPQVVASLTPDSPVVEPRANFVSRLKEMIRRAEINK